MSWINEEGPPTESTQKLDSQTKKPWRGKGRVLIVEDEACVRNVLARGLQMMGFSVEATEDGEQALERYLHDSSRFVFCLLDMTLPGKNGVETLQDLRRKNPELKAIIMSGYCKEDFTCLEETHFLQKPMSLSTLREAAKTLLEA